MDYSFYIRFLLVYRKYVCWTNKSYALDKTKLFEYSIDDDKHVYGSYDGHMGLADTKGKLIYDFDLKSKASMSIRFKPVVSSLEDRTIIMHKKDGVNLFGIDSTINLSFGLTNKKGLYFGVGHSMKTGEGVVTTTWGHRVVPYAFATVAIKTYNYVKEKVQNIDWNVIGRVAKGVAIVALIAVGAWAVITFAPGLLPIVAKLEVPALASFIVYLNL